MDSAQGVKGNQVRNPRHDSGLKAVAQVMTFGGPPRRCDSNAADDTYPIKELSDTSAIYEKTGASHTTDPTSTSIYCNAQNDDYSIENNNDPVSFGKPTLPTDSPSCTSNCLQTRTAAEEVKCWGSSSIKYAHQVGNNGPSCGERGSDSAGSKSKTGSNTSRNGNLKEVKQEWQWDTSDKGDDICTRDMSNDTICDVWLVNTSDEVRPKDAGDDFEPCDIVNTSNEVRPRDVSDDFYFGDMSNDDLRPRDMSDDVSFQNSGPQDVSDDFQLCDIVNTSNEVRPRDVSDDFQPRDVSDDFYLSNAHMRPRDISDDVYFGDMSNADMRPRDMSDDVSFQNSGPERIVTNFDKVVIKEEVRTLGIGHNNEKMRPPCMEHVPISCTDIPEEFRLPDLQENDTCSALVYSEQPEVSSLLENPTSHNIPNNDAIQGHGSEHDISTTECTLGTTMKENESETVEEVSQDGDNSFLSVDSDVVEDEPKRLMPDKEKIESVRKTVEIWSPQKRFNEHPETDPGDRYFLEQNDNLNLMPWQRSISFSSQNGIQQGTKHDISQTSSELLVVAQSKFQTNEISKNNISTTESTLGTTMKEKESDTMKEKESETVEDVSQDVDNCFLSVDADVLEDKPKTPMSGKKMIERIRRMLESLLWHGQLNEHPETDCVDRSCFEQSDNLNLLLWQRSDSFSSQYVQSKLQTNEALGTDCFADGLQSERQYSTSVVPVKDFFDGLSDEEESNIQATKADAVPKNMEALFQKVRLPPKVARHSSVRSEDGDRKRTGFTNVKGSSGSKESRDGNRPCLPRGQDERQLVLASSQGSPGYQGSKSLEPYSPRASSTAPHCYASFTDPQYLGCTLEKNLAFGKKCNLENSQTLYTSTQLEEQNKESQLQQKDYIMESRVPSINVNDELLPNRTSKIDTQDQFREFASDEMEEDYLKNASHSSFDAEDKLHVGSQPAINRQSSVRSDDGERRKQGFAASIGYGSKGSRDGSSSWLSTSHGDEALGSSTEGSVFMEQKAKSEDQRSRYLVPQRPRASTRSSGYGSSITDPQSIVDGKYTAQSNMTNQDPSEKKKQAVEGSLTLQIQKPVLEVGADHGSNTKTHTINIFTQLHGTVKTEKDYLKSTSQTETGININEKKLEKYGESNYVQSTPSNSEMHTQLVGENSHDDVDFSNKVPLQILSHSISFDPSGQEQALSGQEQAQSGIGFTQNNMSAPQDYLPHVNLDSVLRSLLKSQEGAANPKFKDPEKYEQLLENICQHPTTPQFSSILGNAKSTSSGPDPELQISERNNSDLLQSIERMKREVEENNKTQELAGTSSNHSSAGLKSDSLAGMELLISELSNSEVGDRQFTKVCHNPHAQRSQRTPTVFPPTTGNTGYVTSIEKSEVASSSRGAGPKSLRSTSPPHLHAEPSCIVDETLVEVSEITASSQAEANTKRIVHDGVYRSESEANVSSNAVVTPISSRTTEVEQVVEQPEETDVGDPMCLDCVYAGAQKHNNMGAPMPVSWEHRGLSSLICYAIDRHEQEEHLVAASCCHDSGCLDNRCSTQVAGDDSITRVVPSMAKRLLMNLEQCLNTRGGRKCEGCCDVLQCFFNHSLTCTEPHCDVPFCLWFKERHRNSCDDKLLDDLFKDYQMKKKLGVMHTSYRSAALSLGEDYVQIWMTPSSRTFTQDMWEAGKGHIKPGWFMDNFGKFNVIYCKLQLSKEYEGRRSSSNIGFIIKKAPYSEDVREILDKISIVEEHFVEHFWCRQYVRRNSGVVIQNSMFVCTRYYQGGSLLYWLQCIGKCAKPSEFHGQVLNLFEQVLKAVEFLHDLRILYLNWHANNLVLDSRAERVYLSNFTTAVVYHDDDHSRNIRPDRIQSVNPRIAPPELVIGTELSPQSDVWGVGCLLYQMLAGSMPYPDFIHMDPQILRDKIRDEFPPIKPIISSNAGSKVADFLARCWMQDPRARNTIQDLRNLGIFRSGNNNGNNGPLWYT